MSTEQNKAVVRRLVEEVWNKKNLAMADELFAVDFVNHAAPPGTPPGPGATKQFITIIHAAFPDLRFVTEDLIAEGDRVVVRATVRGTHNGVFPTPIGIIAPTGKQVTMTGIIIFRIAGGKVAEEWVNRDMLGLLQQLGAIPPIGESRK